jgi:hypothetical protein
VGAGCIDEIAEVHFRVLEARRGREEVAVLQYMPLRVNLGDDAAVDVEMCLLSLVLRVVAIHPYEVVAHHRLLNKGTHAKSSNPPAEIKAVKMRKTKKR